MKSEDRLEKRADLEYDVLVKRKETKQVKSPAFESGIPPQKKAGKIVVGGKDMYIIAGLGNPGKQYAQTRHNVGFDTIDILADKYNISVDTKKHKALCGKGMIEGQKVVLAKPQTFMNLSGESVRELVDFYKIDPEEELIVIYDDIDLEPGQLRIRKKGSAGGHNGIKDIIRRLGTEKFIRIRVGVGAKPKDWDLADFVLGHFSDSDRKLVDEGINDAAEAVEMILSEGVDAAMNKYNRKKPKN